MRRAVWCQELYGVEVGSEGKRLTNVKIFSRLRRLFNTSTSTDRNTNSTADTQRH
jgi:hypothetical protein